MKMAGSGRWRNAGGLARGGDKPVALVQRHGQWRFSNRLQRSYLAKSPRTGTPPAQCRPGGAGLREYLRIAAWRKGPAVVILRLAAHYFQAIRRVGDSAVTNRTSDRPRERGRWRLWGGGSGTFLSRRGPGVPFVSLWRRAAGCSGAQGYRGWGDGGYLTGPSMTVPGLVGVRDVAQPGSAPEWGSGGRGFESRRPDSKRAGPRACSFRVRATAVWPSPLAGGWWLPVESRPGAPTVRAQTPQIRFTLASLCQARFACGKSDWLLTSRSSGSAWQPGLEHG